MMIRYHQERIPQRGKGKKNEDQRFIQTNGKGK